jgi:ABC-type antimicrobial peptide transport system permease subunit
LYEKVNPCFFRLENKARNIAVKLEAGREQQAIAQIQTYYKQYNLGLSPDYKFLDDEYQSLYVSEQRVAVLSRYFASLAIIISCLGLFGLAAFTAEKRLKEIGIRKVLGASVSNVVVMLSKDFFKLIAVAICISFPLSWWIMSDWLEGFAYRVDIGAMVFLIAGASIVAITILTISSQAIKAGLSNPVKSLRAE